MRFIFLVFLFTFSIFAKSIGLGSDVKINYFEASKGDSKFYLVGTMHLPDRRSKRAFELIKPLIDKSDMVYTEIPFDPFSQMLAMKYSLRDDNKSLSEILPKGLYDELDEYLKSISPMLSAKSFDKMKIDIIALSLGALKEQIYNRRFEPLDKMIFFYAFKEHKNPKGIESIKEQAELFDDFTQSQKIEMLKEALKAIKKYPNQNEMIMKYYFSGDSKDLLKLFKKYMMEDESKLSKKIIDIILYKRNLKMAERIDKTVSKTPKRVYLFAFGAMHFLGEKSVIEYLKEKGYKIKEKILEKKALN